MENTKVLILAYSNPWHQATASSNRLLSLIDGLMNEGLELKVFVYGPYRNKQERQMELNNAEHYSKCCKFVLPIVISGSFKTRLYNYIGKYLIQPILFKNLTDQSEAHNIIWLDSTVFSLRLAKILKRKHPNIKLFIEQSEFLDIYKSNKGNILHSLVGKRRQKLFENEIFPCLSGLALMTKTLFSHYKSFPEPQPNMLHLPMTVDLERFNQIAPAPIEFQKPYIAFVGVMNDAKDGVNILLESFAELAEEFSDYKLYLVGGWNYDTPAHLNFIKERRLENHIFWMKEYPRDIIPAIIGNADLLVLPRPDSKQAQGGFPTKLGEYLATGNPVCATSVGEIPDYLDDNESVFFAQPGSVESFAEAMRRALYDPENAKRVGLNGKKVAQKEFNKDIQAKKLHQFLLELQANKR